MACRRSTWSVCTPAKLTQVLFLIVLYETIVIHRLHAVRHWHGICMLDTDGMTCCFDNTCCSSNSVVVEQLWLSRDTVASMPQAMESHTVRHLLGQGMKRGPPPSAIRGYLTLES